MAESRKKIILNTDTGIFYFGIEDAAITIGKTKKWLQARLCGKRKNKTNFLYV
jgi:hypothetical protein